MTDNCTNYFEVNIDSSLLSKIVSMWNISYERPHSEIQISGSPERCDYRIVIEDKSAKFYVLEKIRKDQIEHKKLIASSLYYLSNQDFPEISAYLKKDGSFIKKIEQDFWLIRPYVKGIELNRPDYVFDAWRGKKTSDFLICLWKKTETFPIKEKIPLFSLKDYVLTMKQKMKTYHPLEFNSIESIIDYLSSDFFRNYDSLPLRFCHGDYHSLNIIWDYDSIRSVIDWEFCGYKIEIYDMANLLGCLGIEEPISLIKDFALEFIKRIKESKMVSNKGLFYLFDCVLALRFAWLAEWLRKCDEDMIELEIDYMILLLENKEKIKNCWNKC